MTRATLMLGTAMAMLPHAAWAQVELASADAAEQAITVTATRTPTPVDRVPATVTVIDEEQIADQLATDANDLVRFEPGVSVPRSPARFGAALGSTGRDGNSGFTIRGIGGNRVLIQVDGIRIPDSFGFGAQLTGRGDYVDLGIVRSVEILRGPASALYGSDGLAGAVSFQTSDPSDLLGDGRDVTGMVRAGYTSDSDEFSETALVAARSGAWSGLVSYTRRDGHELENQGENDAENSTRTTPNPQNTRSNAVLGKIVFAPNDNHRFRVTAEYGDSFVFTDVLSGRSATVVDLYGRDTSERKRVSFDWRYTGDGVIDFAQLALYWQDSDNRQFTFEDRQPAVDRTRINTFDNRIVGGSAEARSTLSTGAIQHTLVFGGDLSVTRQEGLRDGTVPPAGETFPTRAFPVTDFTLAGVFIGDEIGFAGGAFTLHPALRFDYYDLDASDDPLLPSFQGADQNGSRVTPRIGAVWRFAPNLSLYGNYAMGFKAPSPTQVNQFFENLTSPFFSYRTIPNPDLRPETSETWEAGIRYRGPIASASITGFIGRYDDFISQEQIGGAGTIANPILFQFVNLDRVEIEGVEARGGLDFPNGFNADFSFAWATGDIVEPGNVTRPLASIDPIKLVLGAGYRDPGGRFGAQLHLTAIARKPLERTTGVCTGTCYRPDASTVLDATAFWRINDNFTLRAGLFNITDERYAYWSDVAGLAAATAVADAYTRPGRNVRVSLTARF
ncbi:TonB-dependent hemoglobin/transferrin/lactoferrin family receptor [Sphingosinicella sp. LHD-64]|uniref:TonB-dependent hemoglobin/transferrin/lactoferrin family receptor n=1 Tax=Sphingosinicella sp. LHD-64 TaxID=3072139 RepID=UPI00280D4F66|nr:TonB-dependent hemoglobin/transferrin/lactoferrin family receptor [Sphingosinicella sp. LHD-64]MDQ8756616.1 TonB-dependent hemoglobin/transferrin/lactoferrin family receptor [Sphingosinicella sp. LHD-64]